MTANDTFTYPQNLYVRLFLVPDYRPKETADIMDIPTVTACQVFNQHFGSEVTAVAKAADLKALCPDGT